jgi:hypothetical protein
MPKKPTAKVNRARTGPSPRPTKWAASKVKEVRTPKSATQRQVEAKTGRSLTQRQKRFAEHYVEGIYSLKRAAMLAGYSETSAKEYAYHLTNPQKYPHVCEYIAELQEERERKYGVTLNGQLKRLHDLSQGAEQVGQFSAAINAEKLRSVLGGLTVDRRENINTIDQMTKDQILNRLSELQKKYPNAFEVIDGQYDVVQEMKALDHEPLDD